MPWTLEWGKAMGLLRSVSLKGAALPCKLVELHYSNGFSGCDGLLASILMYEEINVAS